MNLDHKYSHLLFHATKKHWFSSHVAIACSTHLIWLMVGIVVGISSWDQLLYRFTVDSDTFVFLLLLLPAWLITILISILRKRERPYIELKQKPLVDPFIHTASFPSGHATIAFSIVAISVNYPNLMPWMFVAAVLVALGRVASGVHFISDVLFGALVGFGVTYYSMAILFVLIAK